MSWAFFKELGGYIYLLLCICIVAEFFGNDGMSFWGNLLAGFALGVVLSCFREWIEQKRDEKHLCALRYAMQELSQQGRLIIASRDAKGRFARG